MSHLDSKVNITVGFILFWNISRFNNHMGNIYKRICFCFIKEKLGWIRTMLYSWYDIDMEETNIKKNIMVLQKKRLKLN